MKDGAQKSTLTHLLRLRFRRCEINLLLTNTFAARSGLFCGHTVLAITLLARIDVQNQNLRWLGWPLSPKIGQQVIYALAVPLQLRSWFPTAPLAPLQVALSCLLAGWRFQGSQGHWWEKAFRCDSNDATVADGVVRLIRGIVIFFEQYVPLLMLKRWNFIILFFIDN